MFELNVNIAVVLLGVISGVSDYLRRRKIAPYPSRLAAALTSAVIYVGSGLAWYFALNALRLHWASLAGFGVGILVGLLGVAIMFGCNLFANRRRRDWR